MNKLKALRSLDYLFDKAEGCRELYIGYENGLAKGRTYTLEQRIRFEVAHAKCTLLYRQIEFVLDLLDEVPMEMNPRFQKRDVVKVHPKEEIVTVPEWLYEP